MDEPTAPAEASPSWPVPRTVQIPRAADERTMLAAYLDYFRDTIRLKVEGVPRERMAEHSVAPSTLSLHGLIRHLAGVERWWFATNFAGSDLPSLYYTDENPNLDFEPGDADPATDLAVWQAECERSRQIVAAAADLDTVGARDIRGSFTLRWLMLRMIAEYAQHAGHADLVRERIDGATGA